MLHTEYSFYGKHLFKEKYGVVQGQKLQSPLRVLSLNDKSEKPYVCYSFITARNVVIFGAVLIFGASKFEHFISGRSTRNVDCDT